MKRNKIVVGIALFVACSMCGVRADYGSAWDSEPTFEPTRSFGYECLNGITSEDITRMSQAERVVLGLQLQREMDEQRREDTKKIIDGLTSPTARKNIGILGGAAAVLGALIGWNETSNAEASERRRIRLQEEKLRERAICEEEEEHLRIAREAEKKARIAQCKLDAEALYHQRELNRVRNEEARKRRMAATGAGVRIRQNQARLVNDINMSPDLCRHVGSEQVGNLRTNYKLKLTALVNADDPELISFVIARHIKSKEGKIRRELDDIIEIDFKYIPRGSALYNMNRFKEQCLPDLVAQMVTDLHSSSDVITTMSDTHALSDITESVSSGVPSCASTTDDERYSDAASSAADDEDDSLYDAASLIIQDSLARLEGCRICNETLGDAHFARAACGHAFHRDCINDHVGVHHECPSCQARLDATDIRDFVTTA